MAESDRNFRPVPREEDLRTLTTLNKRIGLMFNEMGSMLRKPYTPSLQLPLETRFRTSPGRIVAIGNIELRLGRVRRPIFTARYDEWYVNYDEAIERGYKIKKFVEYLEKS